VKYNSSLPVKLAQKKIRKEKLQLQLRLSQVKFSGFLGFYNIQKLIAAPKDISPAKVQFVEQVHALYPC
jgi:hypothetical protein